MKAYYRGMEVIIYGFNGIYADCFVKDVERRHNILISDIELMGA